jgi:hypothetical protein
MNGPGSDRAKSRLARATVRSVKRLLWFAVVLVALAFAAVSVAASQHRVSARLTTRVEVPKPVAATRKAFGSFTGSYVVHAKDVKLTWKLAFVHLTGRATAATLRLGKPGKIGTQITVLCKPCKSGAGATTLMNKAVATVLRAGETYVTVYTRRNPAGEIRGQLRVKS